MFFELKVIELLKLGQRGLEKIELPIGNIIFIAIFSVLHVELKGYQVSMISAVYKKGLVLLYTGTLNDWFKRLMPPSIATT